MDQMDTADQVTEGNYNPRNRASFRQIEGSHLVTSSPFYVTDHSEGRVHHENEPPMLPPHAPTTNYPVDYPPKEDPASASEQPPDSSDPQLDDATIGDTTVGETTILSSAEDSASMRVEETNTANASSEAVHLPSEGIEIVTVLADEEKLEEKENEEEMEEEMEIRDEKEPAVEGSIPAEVSLASGPNVVDKDANPDATTPGTMSVLFNAYCVYEFQAAEEHELSMGVGDWIEVLNNDDLQGWWLARRMDTQAMGLIPSNYVELVRHRMTMTSAASPYRRSLQIEPHNPNLRHLPIDKPKVIGIVVATRSYLAACPEEMSIVPGDRISVTWDADPFWFEGYLERTNQLGFVPVAYTRVMSSKLKLKQLKQQIKESKSAKSPQNSNLSSPKSSMLARKAKLEMDRQEQHINPLFGLEI
jgi:hypothetical protein